MGNFRKLIYVVIDGLGDLPISELGHCTPLEKAETPNMDLLARKARLGLMYTVGKGIAPESDVAVISILGYDPFKYHVGRGPLEAYGAGLDMKTGDLALRCNFATLGEDRRIIDRRAGRNLMNKEAAELSNAINEHIKLRSYPAEIEFRKTLGHRGVLVIRSEKHSLTGNITNTDPAYERLAGLGVAKTKFELVLNECLPMENTVKAQVSSCLVNEFTESSHLVLEHHEVNERRIADGKLKANIILTRDAGDKLPTFFSLNERYGVSFACLADMPVERGISRLAGMYLFELPSPSDDARADMLLRKGKLLQILPDFDCFYIHLKGPDEPGHDGDFKLKEEIIADIDEHFFGTLLPDLNLEETLICITADHSTPCSLKNHSDDPVPLLIAGGGIKPDGLTRFSEEECSKGSLGLLYKGTELMPMLMKSFRKTNS